MAVFLWTEKSLYKAMKALLGWRYKGQHHAGLQIPQATGSPNSTIANKILSRVSASSTTLFTTIKILGSQGLVWTKVTAAAFFFSFIISELLVVWPAIIWPEMLISIPIPNANLAPNGTPEPNEAPEDNEDREPNEILEPNETPLGNNEEESAYLVTYSSIALLVMFMLWFASAAVQNGSGEPQHTQPQYLAKTVSFLGCPLAALAFWYVCCGQIVNMKNRKVSAVILGALVSLSAGS
ncbi:hypothetical protein CGCSCA4_v001776 [Colletotrichum siamense]|uniref:Uncharacterized protein n=1 Tax=Colletotrichum siamense TaxID=690259 RepID=A0A9P5F2Q5_COLSI|nr:hypothetical protein CGCSCA4_v001776 [Colletotrichum siamense]KAF4864740.1 hypothetical protein CGCSCA2_v001912 [Colletotrichum siamense]